MPQAAFTLNICVWFILNETWIHVSASQQNSLCNVKLVPPATDLYLHNISINKKDGRQITRNAFGKYTLRNLYDVQFSITIFKTMYLTYKNFRATGRTIYKSRSNISQNLRCLSHLEMKYCEKIAVL